MLIEIHAIQNHSPSNLNRDDLGAPKTCYFGGVMRSRISSQCLKRSIRTSREFASLLGGVATRRLAQLVAGNQRTGPEFKRAMKILTLCGIAPKAKRKANQEDDDAPGDKSAGRVFTTRGAVEAMASLLKNEGTKDEELAAEFSRIIASKTAVPDMALCGRMLEPKKPAAKAASVWKDLDLTVEAALQVAHAISTHEARPEVDYFVAADDIPGDDAGAAYVDEAMFASACFYKYFSIDWETLVRNLSGFGESREQLAAHTLGAFLRGAALTTPTGKQNSFAAHNPPDGLLVEIKNTPISYANAFAAPVPGKGERDMISQSIAQLGQYIHDLDVGYGRPETRLWFSPNRRFGLTALDSGQEKPLADRDIGALEELVQATVKAVGFDWSQVQTVTVA